MYISTNQVQYRAQKGWYGIVHNPAASFDIVFGEREYGMTGVKSIKTWARIGRCNKPSGRHAAMWRTLMLLHGARYIAMEYTGTVDIEIMDPELLRRLKHGPKLEHLRVKAEILKSALGGDYLLRMRDQQRDLWVRVEGDAPAQDAPCTVLRLGMYGNRAGTNLFHAFVAELGPPLNPASLLNLITEVEAKRTVRAACKLQVTENRDRYWRRYDATTVIRRKKR